MSLEIENIYQKTKITESMLSVILESSNIGYFNWDLKNKTIFYNKKWFEENGFKIPKESKTLKKFFKLISEEDRKKFILKFREHSKDNKKNFSIDSQMNAKGSEQIWVKISGQIIKRDANGNPCLFVGVLQNINEEKKLLLGYQKLNTALQKRKNEIEIQKKNIESLSKLIPGMLFKFRYNFDGTAQFEYISEGIKNLFGVKPNDFTDFDKFLSLLAPEYRDSIKNEFKNKLTKLKDLKTDGKFILENGEEKWIHAHATFDQIGDNYVIYAGIAYDITSRIQLLKKVKDNNKKLSILNNKLQYDNHKLEYIFDSIKTLVIIWNGYGVISYANTYVEEIFKFKKAELLGQSWMNLIVPSKDKTGIDTKKLLEQVILNPDNFVVNHNYNIDREGNLYYINWSNLSYCDMQNQKHVLSIGNILEKYQFEKVKTRQSISKN